MNSNAQPTSSEWISVPNPIDIFGMPVFEGHVHEAPKKLEAGLYAAKTETDEPCELLVTDDGARVLPTTHTFSLDDLAAALRALRFDATVEKTENNTATLFAGPRHNHGTWTLAAGPGKWTPNGSTADLTDFHIRTGPTHDEPIWSATAADTIGDVLMTVAGHIVCPRASRP